MLKQRFNKKGFTLAELLIVVAILGVLVAIAIPMFGGALQSAAVNTDAANLRAAKAEVANYVLLTKAGESSGITIATGDYYDFINDTWSATKVVGKSDANKSNGIKVTITGSGTTLTASVAWAS